MSQATITNAADCTRCSKSYTSRGVARFHLREDETSKVSRGWILNFSMEMFWCIFILYEAKFKSITNVLYTVVNTEGTWKCFQPRRGDIHPCPFTLATHLATRIDSTPMVRQRWQHENICTRLKRRRNRIIDNFSSRYFTSKYLLIKDLQSWTTFCRRIPLLYCADVDRVEPSFRHLRQWVYGF